MTYSGILLDTNAYSAIANGDKAARAVIEGIEHVGLPMTVIGEIYFGAFDGKLQKYNLDTLDAFLSHPAARIIDIDKSTAIIYGELSAQLKAIGKIPQQNDIWIAALAKQHDYPLMTRDQAFNHIIGLRLVSW